MKYALILALSVLSITSNTAKHNSSLLLNSNHIYSNVGKVIELDRKNDIVTVIDGIGYTWQFTECDDWMIGDYVSCIMYDMCTESITDDIIIDYHYEIVPE